MEKIKYISHGTIGLNLLTKQNLNLTSVKKIDEAFGEEDWFSFNITPNHFYYSLSYIGSNKVKGWKILNKNSTKRFPSIPELRQKKLVSAIQVWIYDDRFKNLPLVTRNYTKHHCIKKGIKLQESEKLNFSEHRELLIKNQLLKPLTNIIIFGKDILNYFCDFNHIKDFYHIPDSTRIIVDNTYLDGFYNHANKYESRKQRRKGKWLTQHCNYCIDNNIYNYIVE